MGRIRSIKPELLDDEKTASLENLEWRLFVSLWLLADDYGNLRGRPSQIKGATLWATRDDEEDVDLAIERLVEVGLVQSYYVGGQRYLHISGWAKHQLVKNPGKPLMPGPEKADDSGPCKTRVEPTESLRRDGVDTPLVLPSDQRTTINEQEDELELRASARKPKRNPKGHLPDDWSPAANEIARAEKSGLDVNREAEKFRNHAAQNDRKCADWNAAFRNWLINAEDRQKPQQAQQSFGRARIPERHEYPPPGDQEI